MRQQLPTRHDRAAAVQQRMQSAKDVKTRPRLHALYLVASGPARHRKAMAPLLGVHRHRGAAWWEANI
jgi:hypothetical protein